MEPEGEITRLIREWQGGDRAAEAQLFEALYRTLHNIARSCLRAQPESSLGPTALIHEAYLRFANSEKLDINDRNHFLALAARVMRRIVVDRARARKSEKRGGENRQVEFTAELVKTEEDAEEILTIDEALDKLSEQSPRQAKLVELRYFGGFSIDETAAVLGVSSRTARREWQVARLRLKMAIDGERRSEGLDKHR